VEDSMHPYHDMFAKAGAMDHGAVSNVTRATYHGHRIRPHVKHTILLNVRAGTDDDITPIGLQHRSSPS